MHKSIYWLLSIILIGCIGDDLVFDEVDPVVRIMNPVDTLEINSTYQFNVSYFNNVGEEGQLPEYSWSSSAPDVVSIDNTGLATAISLGKAEITVTGNSPDGITLRDSRTIAVGTSTVLSSGTRTGTLRTTSSYALTGAFTLEEISGGVKLSFGEDYRASSALPGLYVYLTNNPNSNSNALEIGKVTTFSGAHLYEVMGVGLNEYSHVLYYCKPFSVKVGDGAFDN
ncbi:MAG: hypothetical protein HKN76_09370 [Saprospiraceae bacterium]|nr:hypothetical protein [Saprospiraceae bacterium]